MRANEFIIETINPDILDPRFTHTQEIGDYTYKAFAYEGRPGVQFLRVQAFDGSPEVINRVGDILFRVNDSLRGGHLESINTYVADEYQKRGIASTMYAYAKMLGNDIMPSKDQLPPGKAMWASWEKSGDAQHLMKETRVEINQDAPDNLYDIQDKLAMSRWKLQVKNVITSLFAKQYPGIQLFFKNTEDGNLFITTDKAALASEDVGLYSDTNAFGASIIGPTAEYGVDNILYVGVGFDSIKSGKYKGIVGEMLKTIVPPMAAKLKAKPAIVIVVEDQSAGAWEAMANKLGWAFISGEDEGSMKEEITELFDPKTSFPLEWDEQFASQGEVHAQAYDADGRTIGVSFTPIGDNLITDIVFTRGGSYDMTGKGDAAKVLATVINAISIYLQKYKPSYVVFSAKSTGGRASAYAAMIKRLARGYTLLQSDQYPAALGEYLEFIGNDIPFVLARQ